MVDLSVDENVDKMVELCFAKKNISGLDSTFWRFENIDAVKDPELKKEISRRIKKSDSERVSTLNVVDREPAGNARAAMLHKKSSYKCS